MVNGAQPPLECTHTQTNYLENSSKDLNYAPNSDHHPEANNF